MAQTKAPAGIEPRVAVGNQILRKRREKRNNPPPCQASEPPAVGSLGVTSASPSSAAGDRGEARPALFEGIRCCKVSADYLCEPLSSSEQEERAQLFTTAL